MRPAASALVVLVLVAPALVAGPTAVAAEDERVLRWEYVVEADAATPGVAHVTIRFSGLKGIVERMGFLTASHPYPISNVSSSTSRIEPTQKGIDLVVEKDSESFSFDVQVNRAAHKAGEYNAYLGPEWGLVKAESFALGFTYSYLQGTPFRWEASVRFDLPDGWRAEMPYARGASANAFALPAGEVLPRGFIALGPLSVETRQAAGKEFRYARIGEALEHEADLFPYLEKATPYYARVYGDAADGVILAVSAPSPLLRGGLGSTNSLYVHEESDLRTLAHEYAHVWQLFGTVTESGSASVWLNEGDAEYHGALSLFVTDYWSLDDVNDFLRDFDGEKTTDPYRGSRLPLATYGSALEDVAYHKGALVLHALDALMRESSKGGADVAALLRELNEAHDQRVDGDGADARASRLAPVTNEEVLATVNRLVQESQPYDFSPFFEAYVHGREYPPFEPLLARENLAIANLTLSPERAVEGATVTATVRVENRGIAAATKRIPLIVDGEQIDARDVTVPVGEAQDVRFVFEAPGPGRHQVRSYYFEAYLDVLTPARLGIARIASVPDTLIAGSAGELLVYVTNAGELAGDVTVSAVADGSRRLGERSATVAGNVTTALSFPLVFTTAGRHSVEVQLAGGGAAQTLDATFDVVPPDSDADGVPDEDDPYPTNRQLTEKSVGNDVRNAVPASGLVLVLAALSAACLLRRR